MLFKQDIYIRLNWPNYDINLIEISMSQLVRQAPEYVAIVPVKLVILSDLHVLLTIGRRNVKTVGVASIALS